jgi:glycosyltransferase involved in cell wall biosynthesis
LRILYFTRDYTSHDLRFLQALAKTEHKIYFLQLERRGHAFEDRPLPVEIEQVHWAGGHGPAQLRDGPQLLWDLKRVIRKIKPDLIQAGPLQRTAFLVALTGFQPLLSMSWGYDLLVDADQNAAWRWATRYTLKHSRAMLGDCDTIRKLAVAYGMADERIVTFPWGIDLEHFSPAPLRSKHQLGEPPAPDSSFARSPFVLLSSRGWEPIYGVDVIARAFVIAARQRPELNLIMLGNGSLTATLRQIFAKGNVEEQVMFPGQVKYSDLPRYYQMADLYVSASHSDGSSISLLEAMACGKPVLVSDIPGNCEWVRPFPQRSEGEISGIHEENKGDVGWLFPDGDAEALAQAILQAVEQRNRLPEMGQRARALAEARADWKVNFPRLFEAYEIALSKAN